MIVAPAGPMVVGKVLEVVGKVLETNQPKKNWNAEDSGTLRSIHVVLEVF